MPHIPTICHDREKMPIPCKKVINESKRLIRNVIVAVCYLSRSQELLEIPGGCRRD
mgnify:CR=1 FL=1